MTQTKKKSQLSHQNRGEHVIEMYQTFVCQKKKEKKSIPSESEKLQTKAQTRQKHIEDRTKKENEEVKERSYRRN